MPRSTVRLRLTALYGLAFLTAGGALLGINYALLSGKLPASSKVVVQVAPSPYAVANKLANDPTADPAARALARQILQAPPDVANRLAKSNPQFFVNGKPTSVTKVGSAVSRSTLHQLVEQGALALGLMTLVSTGLGWLLAGRALRPVKEMTATARRLSAENLHERIALTGPKDELRELADTFDAMLERLDRAFMSQQRFVADASHELRTPLAVIRTEVDVALADPDASAADLRAMAEVVREATERSQSLVDGLLMLARTGAVAPPETPVDLADVSARVVDRLAPEADALELALDLSLDPARVRGDRALLERLIENLVENALRYNEHGGWISVSTSAAGDTASLRIANSGPLVPPEQVASLFERFRRLDDWDHQPGHRSFGLGLSIVDAVARAHGGSATAEAQPDGGLLVVVALPAAVAPAEAALAPG